MLCFFKSQSSEGVQGFAVPTPKVPMLPPFHEPKINGTGEITKLKKHDDQE